jgi:hypothetical protein
LKQSVPKEVSWALEQLSSDSKIVGTCPECGKAAPLAAWNLFYLDQYPRGISDMVDDLRSVPDDLEREYKEMKKSSTVDLMKRSVRVHVGQAVEQVAPGLASFPYNSADCRSVFKPIDYIVFDGLADMNRIRKIHFIDVKTGSAKLNKHEKQIAKTIDNKKVDFGLF